MKRIFILLFLAFAALGFSKSSLERINDEQISKLPSTGRIVVVNFWATWCKPCQIEIPALNRLHRKHSAINFVGVNVDDIENEGAIPGFLRKHPIQYKVVLRHGSDFEAMAGSLDPQWKGGLPATFIFKEGKRVYSKLGMIDEKELDKVLQHINS